MGLPFDSALPEGAFLGFADVEVRGSGDGFVRAVDSCGTVGLRLGDHTVLW